MYEWTNGRMDEHKWAIKSEMKKRRDDRTMEWMTNGHKWQRDIFVVDHRSWFLKASVSMTDVSSQLRELMHSNRTDTSVIRKIASRTWRSSCCCFPRSHHLHLPSFVCLFEYFDVFLSDRRPEWSFSVCLPAWSSFCLLLCVPVFYSKTQSIHEVALELPL